MRVIAGKKRGMKLSGFEGEAIRPTADRVKENMFNLIAPHVADAEVLDLFAGTGALSIEALSRGAAHAVLCEQARSSLGIIRKNVEKTGFLEQCSIVEGDCFGFLARNYKKFNLIFLDPPYNTGMLLKALRMIGRGSCLAAGGVVVAECDGPERPGEIAGLTLIKERRYGRTYILIYMADGRESVYEDSGISGQL